MSLKTETERLKKVFAEDYITLCGGHDLVDTLINDGGYDYPLSDEQVKDYATILKICQDNGPAVVFEPVPGHGFVLRCSTPEAVAFAKIIL